MGDKCSQEISICLLFSHSSVDYHVSQGFPVEMEPMLGGDVCIGIPVGVFIHIHIYSNFSLLHHFLIFLFRHVIHDHCKN